MSKTKLLCALTTALASASMFATPAVAQNHHAYENANGNAKFLRCGTEDPSLDRMLEIERKVQAYRDQKKGGNGNGNGNGNGGGGDGGGTGGGGGGTGSAPGSIVVDVYWHVLRTDSGQGGVSQSEIDASIASMNAGFAGTLGGLATATPFTFQLAGVTTTDNTDWYQARYGSAEESATRNALRAGDATALNVYSGEPRNNSGSLLLGYATFPDEYASNPVRDGVFILNTSVPGGASAGYNEGDTLTHEVGHWLGLYHTFQGGCQGGDLVSDTPAQRSPTSGCPSSSNTCKGGRYPGDDPIHNFMDYSTDVCLFEFTPGQSTRADDQWMTFRAGN